MLDFLVLALNYLKHFLFAHLICKNTQSKRLEDDEEDLTKYSNDHRSTNMLYLPFAVSFCFCSKGGFLLTDSSPAPFYDGVLASFRDGVPGPPALKISLRDALPDLFLVALPSRDLLVYLSPVFGAFFTSAVFTDCSAAAAEGPLLPRSGPILLVFRILSNFSWMYF